MLTNVEKQQVIKERLDDLEAYISAIETDLTILTSDAALLKSSRTAPLSLDDLRKRRDILYNELLNINNIVDGQL